MPDRQPPSLWGDWTPGDEGQVPTAPPPPPPPAAPLLPDPEPEGLAEERPTYDAGELGPVAGPVTWVLSIGGLAAGITVVLGFVLALFSADTWLLGLVGTDAGIVVETARQAVQVPFGGLLFEGETESFVYGLVLLAALVAATAATAAARLPGPDLPAGRRRAIAAASAIPYLAIMAVVATVASEGDVTVDGGRLVFWGLVLVGGGAAVGAAPLRPDGAPRLRGLARALLVPLAQAWAVLTVVLTLWFLALTVTQQSERVGYEVRESALQVQRADSTSELDLSPAPALAVLALVPANLGLDAIPLAMFSEERGNGPLGSTDAALDRLDEGERRRFLACALGDVGDSCVAQRITDAPDTLPRAFGVFFVLVLVGIALTAAAVAGHRAAGLVDRDSPGLRALTGALVGPVWAVLFVVTGATVDSALDRWSTFTSVLLLGTLLGLAGGAARQPRAEVAARAVQ